MIVLITKANQFIELDESNYNQVSQAIIKGDKHIKFHGKLYSITDAVIANNETEAQLMIGKVLGWYSCAKFGNWHSSRTICKCDRYEKYNITPLQKVGLKPMLKEPEPQKDSKQTFDDNWVIDEETGMVKSIKERNSSE